MEGSIIFLSKRKLRLFNPLSWISNLISLFQGGKEKITHTAIIYSIGNQKYVRSIEWFGFNPDKLCTLEEYVRKFGDRIYSVKKSPRKLSMCEKLDYNKICRETKVSYDFINILYFQPIKILFNKFLGDNSGNRRTCSEDSCRMLGLVFYKFKNCESKTPYDLFKLTKNWTEIKSLILR